MFKQLQIIQLSHCAINLEIKLLDDEHECIDLNERSKVLHMLQKCWQKKFLLNEKNTDSNVLVSFSDEYDCEEKVSSKQLMKLE